MAAAVAVAVAEGNQMIAAHKGTPSWELRCTVRDCACFWRTYCSARIPRVAPGRDYYCIPAGAVHDPAWSLLVGVTDGAVIRLKRLRVDRSGRILGRSDDKLEPFLDLKTPTGPDFSLSAALAPDGHWLCILPQAFGEKPRARLLTVHRPPETEWMPLPEIEETSRCVTISAAGHIWALYATVQQGTNSFSVSARRLVVVAGCSRWEQLGHAFTGPYVDGAGRRWKGGFLQGYAVLPDANLLLVSFKQDGLFLALDLHSGDWTPVVLTHATRLQDYIPILGRGVYLDQDQAVYMLRDNTIYAYKLTLTHQDGDQGKLISLDPPITVDSVCPFNSCIGYGLLTHLQGRLMCSVWISLAWRRQPCHCDYLHAIVTTFTIRDPARGGIEVLHSSYRWLDMEPNPEDQRFCFLQEYEDRDYHPLPLQEEDLTTSHNVDQPPKMLDCCRRLFIESSKTQHKVRLVPPKPVTTYVQKDLFILCQAASKPVIYQTGLVDESLRLEGDHGKLLQPFCVANDADDYWYFVRSGSYIQAVSCVRDVMLEFSLNTIATFPVRRPSAARLAVVMRVGGKTIAMTDTLQVFHLGASSTSSSRTWFRYKADQSHALFRKVMISGYVVLNDDSFIVYDAVTCSCLLFELGVKQWRVVMPWAAFEDGLPRSNPTNCVLAGRCVSVDDFIYTCMDGGLAAYQLLRIDHSVYLSKGILLPFSWQPDCVGEDMCLDYAGKDEKSGSLLFYVVEVGGYSPPKHDVDITIVQVKTERTPSNERKPVGVDLVDTVKRFMHHSETIDARCCFAVSLMRGLAA